MQVDFSILVLLIILTSALFGAFLGKVDRARSLEKHNQIHPSSTEIHQQK
jgi:hypothetical protein